MSELQRLLSARRTDEPSRAALICDDDAASNRFHHQPPHLTVSHLRPLCLPRRVTSALHAILSLCTGNYILTAPQLCQAYEPDCLSVRPSVCLSVCLSVKLRYNFHRNKPALKRFSPNGSPKTLVFGKEHAEIRRISHPADTFYPHSGVLLACCNS